MNLFENCFSFSNHSFAGGQLGNGLSRPSSLHSNFQKNFGWTLVFILIGLILIIKTFFFNVAIVDGNSMYPTLHHQDVLIVKKFYYAVSRDDIVLISLPSSSTKNKYIVKRAIAIGGDTVEVDYENNAIYVNDQKLIEPYINFDQEDPMKCQTDARETFFVVPEGYVFVLGDNRNFSLDSRDKRIGMISESAIVGGIIFHFSINRP